MNPREVILGIILFGVFWAYQMGYTSSLGSSAWFLGAIIFVAVLWVIGKTNMPKSPADIKEVWNVLMLVLLVGTFFMSYLGSYLGAVFPPDVTPAQLTPMVLSFWLVIVGAALFVTGWKTQNGLATAIAVFWLFSALHFVTAVSTGPNSYLHFGFVVGMPYIIHGLIRKK